MTEAPAGGGRGEGPRAQRSLDRVAPGCASVPWPPAFQPMEARKDLATRGWRRFTLALPALTGAAGRDAGDAVGVAVVGQSGDKSAGPGVSRPGFQSGE